MQKENSKKNSETENGVEFAPLDNRNKKKALKLLKVFFPAWRRGALWKFFHREKEESEFLQIKKRRKFFGFLIFSTLMFLGYKFLHLRFFALREKERGQGTGTEVLKKLEQKGRHMGHNILFLFSRPEREKAHKFYFRNGFRRILWFLFWKKLK